MARFSRSGSAPRKGRGIPRMCLHRASGQAVVRLAGKDHYLGRWGSPEAKSAYHRTIAEYLAAGPVVVSAMQEGQPETIGDLTAVYHAHLTAQFKHSAHLAAMMAALRRLLEIHLDTRLDEFGPLALRAFREHLVRIADDDGRPALCRRTVNRYVQYARRMIRWAEAWSWCRAAPGTA